MELIKLQLEGQRDRIKTVSFYKCIYKKYFSQGRKEEKAELQLKASSHYVFIITVLVLQRVML